MIQIRASVLISLSSFALGLANLGSAQNAGSPSGRLIENNTPRFVSTAKNVGRPNPTETIDVAIWLKLHNQNELNQLAEELYDPNSSHYQNWLKPADIAARFAPSAEEVRTVGEFLSSRNLPVVAVGPNNFYVRARGTIADVEKAFRVTIQNFELKGQTYRANTGDPYVVGPAAALVGSVAGLDNLQYKHPVLAPKLPKASSRGFQSQAAGADSDFFTSHCFTGVTTESFSGTDGFGLPASATYTGNSYDGAGNVAGCGYTPPEIWTAYNLTGLYKEGFDGTGQSIAIIDWCGSPTIRDDANAFSARFGLPPLTDSNFHILYSSTLPTCGAPDPEINIDVEWAHAIAPGAKINLVVPPDATFLEVNNAELYAIANGLGNVISASYGSEELFTPFATLNQENLINQVASVLGISANFASGDEGDFTFDAPATNPASVSAPADTPYATAVGGISLALRRNNTMAWQTGWGTNINDLVVSNTIFNPLGGFFYAGSGGGPSSVFSKPPFQGALPGTQRLLPDISWLADPYTGGVIAITEAFVFPPVEWVVYGGTSLATPMFSGLWAIANQEAGVPLGQAARYLYSLPAGAITDVLPVNSSTNVTGIVTDAGFTSFYSAAQLAAPLENTTLFYSALWNVPLEEYTTILLTFGADSGLTVTPGWDTVTGLGTPNGKAFADAFNPARRSALLEAPAK